MLNDKKITEEETKLLFRNKLLQRSVMLICCMIAIAFSIKNLREPDLWWQIRTGEWILQHHSVPHVDIFSFTFSGAEWINIKWGFEVLLALISKISGPESVFIIQAFVSCLLFFFLVRLSKLFRSFSSAEKNESTFYASLFISFIISIVAMEYRMIGRPEMISHLFTVIFLFLLMKNRKQSSKQIYLLIPFQLIWANLHEAFGIGIVLLLIFTISAWIEQRLSRTKKLSSANQNPMQLLLITLGSIASVAVNPNGIKLFTKPFNILSQVYENKYTTELLSFSSPDYWKKEAYITFVIFAIVLLGIFAVIRKQKNKSFIPLLDKYGVGYLLTVLAFLYLALTAYRNIVFFMLILFLLFVSVTEQFLLRISEKRATIFSSTKTTAAIIISGIGIYTLIVSNTYYKWTKSRDRFGLEMLSTFHPSGAADYISSHGLQNKKCFSDYLTSSYLLWKLQPDFKTFIDLRDLDIFTPDFFSKFFRGANSPQAFAELDSIYHFDYAVIYRPQFGALHRYLFNDTLFAMTYVDAVAAVYEKTDSFTREDIFTAASPLPSSTFSNSLNKILNPFYKKFDYSEVNNDYIAGSYYLGVGRYAIAEKRALRCRENKDESYKGMELLGDIYYYQAMGEQDSVRTFTLMNEAIDQFTQAQRKNPEYSPAYSGAGMVFLQLQNYKTAVSNFEKGLKIDPNDETSLLGCAQAYIGLSKSSETQSTDFLKKALTLYLRSDNLSPDDAMTEVNIGFLAYHLNDLSMARKYLKKALNSGLLSADDKQRAEQYLKNSE